MAYFDEVIAGLLDDVDTMHLDRGYDYPKIRAELNDAGLEDLVIQRRRKPGEEHVPMPMRLGLRWIVEDTNSWLSNYANSAATPTDDSTTDKPHSASPSPS